MTTNEKEQRLRALQADLKRFEAAAAQERRSLRVKLTAALARIFGSGESSAGARKRQ